MPSTTIKQGDTLSGLAQQYKTTVSDLMKLNPNISDPNLIYAGAQINIPDAQQPPATPPITPSSTPVAAPATVPQTFDSSVLDAEQKKMQVPPQAELSSPDPFVSSLDTYLKQVQQAFDATNKEVAPIQQEQTGLIEKLKAQLEKLTGKSTALQSKEAELGVPEQQKQLQEINLQIAQLKGEFDKAAMAVEGQPIKMGIITGKQGEIRRQQAVEIGALAAVAQAMQGNIALAQQTAQKSVDLEFEPIEQQIQNSLLLLEINKENLSKAEQKQAEQTEYILKQQLQEVQNKKEEKLQIYEFAQQAAQNGAPNDVVNKILKAANLQDALTLGSEFLAAPAEKKTSIIEANGKILLVDTQTGDVIKDYGKGAVDTLTQKDKFAIAQDLINSGQAGNIDEALDIIGGTPSEFSISIPELTQGNGQAQLAYKNNNPGNLKYIGQAGATAGAGGFAKFETAEAGFEALLADIEAKKAPGGALDSSSTLAEFLNVYAPPSENDTNLYVNQVAAALGVSANTPIGEISTFDLAKQIVKKESQTTVSGGTVQKSQQTFDQYLAAQQEVAKQSFTPEMVADLKEQYDLQQQTGKKLTQAQEIALNIMNPNSNMKLTDVPTKLKPSVSAELNKLKDQAIADGDIFGIIASSAGGGQVSDTFIQSFEKGVNVLQQIGELQSSIQSVATGPIMGTINSKNPYATKSQTLKAQLTAIVPNLAKGIYGEVGVLTDQDIELYSKTLPNLKSTDAVNKAVLGITIKSIQKSLENKIKTQAGFGKDVSGIASVYLEIKELSDSLLIEAGIIPENIPGQSSSAADSYIKSLGF